MPFNKKSLNNLKPGGTVGHKGAGGRPKEEFQRLCREAYKDAKLLEIVKKVGKGEQVDSMPVVYHKSNGEPLVKEFSIIPSMKNRLQAIQMLKEGGYGKDSQEFNSPTLEKIIMSHQKEFGTEVPDEETQEETD